MTKKSQNEAIKRIQEALETGAVGLNLLGLEWTEVPEEIAQLTNLQKLFLHNNQLTSLPDAFTQLTNLQGLYLSDNQLTSLLDAIGQLTICKYFTSETIN